jgi:NAD-dependent SIR2 family protein deacetylase
MLAIEANLEQAISQLARLLKNQRVLVLSGAGISTESGIPDYRSPRALEKPRNPIRYQQFVQSREARQRYWARSLVGWPKMQIARPNTGHRVLAQLEKHGAIQGILTQNVDGLHQAAGSEGVLELHGTLAQVRCLHCQKQETRARLQRRMLHLNPDFAASRPDLAPDGDADLPNSLVQSFTIPDCLACRGILKPEVVFFGENVPEERLERAWQLLAEAECLLVVGTTLSVYSAYRFVSKAAKDGKPIAIINQGITRVDTEATIKIDARLGQALPLLEQHL